MLIPKLHSQETDTCKNAIGLGKIQLEIKISSLEPLLFEGMNINPIFFAFTFSV
jgi:hypothetical protein